MNDQKKEFIKTNYKKQIKEAFIVFFEIISETSTIINKVVAYLLIGKFILIDKASGNGFNVIVFLFILS